MNLRNAQFLRIGFLILAVAPALTAIAPQTPEAQTRPTTQPTASPEAGVEKVKAFVAAVRDVGRFGASAIPVISTQAKTETTATSGLLSAVAQGLKDKEAGTGTDTAPAAVEPVVKKLVVATREMLALRDKAIPPVAAAMNDAGNADVKEQLAKAEIRIYMALCVAAMRGYINPNGTFSGTFDGMFASLDKYDRAKIGDAFLEIFKSPAQTASLRALAGEGLAQLGTARHQAAVKAIFESKSETEGIRQRALYTLARLGDRGPVDKMLASISTRMDAVKKPDMTPDEIRGWAGGYLQSALLAQNVHDSDLAIKHYESFLAAVEPIKDKLAQKENQSGNHYNLACLYSLKGDAEKALKSLAKSFAAGYDDYKWANTDGDLANARKDPRFKALVETWESGKGQPESAPAKQ